MNLAQFSRISLGHFATPLERLDGLTKALNGPEIWIKRDDCTGLSTGGNKTRKLEFLMGAAVDEGADTVVTQGATQSNHARQTAAAAAKLGLACHILLEDRTGKKEQSYRKNGNVLLDMLHGASIEHYPASPDMNMEMDKAADRMRADGRKVYTIPGGGSNPVGALGYVNAAIELASQSNTLGLKVDHLVHGTGSSGTQAGLAAGLVGISSNIPVLGIGVRAPKPRQEEMVYNLARKTGELLGISKLVEREDVVANCDYVGEGYGFPAASTVQAIRLLARTDGILLDPVYSGKGMAGLIDLVRKGFFKKGQTVVFLHTGGSAGLFGYPESFAN